MRQVGTLQDANHARRFADYLVAEGVKAHAEEEPDGWAIWVRDENQLDRARQELEQFRAAPDDARYREAARSADTIRRQEARRSEKAAKNVVQMSGRWNRPLGRKAPLTLALVAASIVLAAMAGLSSRLQPVQTYFTFCRITITPEGKQLVPVTPSGRIDGFRQIVREGQVWRLVTPIFIHFGIVHLVFNMYCLYIFGVQIEQRRKTWRLALLILAIAVTSNVGEYLATGHVAFGGMSGVVYGLFGYVWMKSRFDPGAGLHVDSMTVMMLIGWFFLCLFGLIGNIANWAHGVGLAVGIVIGYAPVLFQKLQRR